MGVQTEAHRGKNEATEQHGTSMGSRLPGQSFPYSSIAHSKQCSELLSLLIQNIFFFKKLF